MGSRIYFHLGQATWQFYPHHVIIQIPSSGRAGRHHKTARVTSHFPAFDSRHRDGNRPKSRRPKLRGKNGKKWNQRQMKSIFCKDENMGQKIGNKQQQQGEPFADSISRGIVPARQKRR